MHSPDVITSLPLQITSSNDAADMCITLVLPLVSKDLSRSSVLFESLCQITSSTCIHSMLIFTPDKDLETVKQDLERFNNLLTFPLFFYSEKILFSNPYAVDGSFSYAIQMSVKLLASKLINTEYYITLDADIILLRPFSISQLLIQYDCESSTYIGCSTRRAIYHQEAKSVHGDWWRGSSKFLFGHDMYIDQSNDLYFGIRHQSSATDIDGLGFGVTPAILSTYGSLLTLNFIQYSRTAAYCQTKNITFDDTPYEKLWLQSFGSDHVWSEYTLYRTVLDQLNIFKLLHTPEFDELHLHCHDVWYAEDLPWNRSLAVESNSCLFSVVQGTANPIISSLL
jgi:hypothetical protein